MPPAAPVVQNLSDIVAQYQAADAPQQTLLDNESQQNEQSGNTQTQGIDAAKTAAFGDIAARANARGATFSGFTPNAQAGYVGGTYLPALAKLQAAIATTRNTILGNKASLVSTENNNALGTQKSQQSALDTYNQNLAAEAATEKRQQEAEAAAAALADKNNAAAASRVASAGPTAAQSAASAQQAANAYLSGKVGGDGKVSPAVFSAARNSWVNGGGSAATFNSTFSNYINQSHAQDYVGKQGTTTF